MWPKKNIVLPFLLLLCLVPSCMLGRFVWYNFADITDYRIFPYRSINTADSTIAIPHSLSPVFPSTIKAYGEQEHDFEKLLADNKTVAFLIIYRDSIHYEKYFDGYSDTAMVTSFSIAKSIISLLIGCAIEDGIIKNEETLVTEYLPELADNGFDKVTIRDLLMMRAGLLFGENYFNPNSDVAKFYYGRRLEKNCLKLKANKTDTTSFAYSSGNSQLLGLILQRALKGESISIYFERKLWKPMGMEYPASWSLDRKDGLEKTFCCVNARARDFAKLGMLMAHEGSWHGKQLVPKEWVQKSTAIDTSGRDLSPYQYQWWMASSQGDFFANGILGQYLYIHPKKNLVVVRFGRDHGRMYWAKLLGKLQAYY